MIRTALALAVLLHSAVLAAETPEDAVRAFFRAQHEGDGVRAVALVESDVPHLRDDIKADLDIRCVQVHGYQLRRVQADERRATIEAVVAVTRTSKYTGLVTSDLERRTIALIRTDAGWRIHDMPLAEEALVDRIAAAKTSAEVDALLAECPELVTPALVRRLVRRALLGAKMGGGPPDRRLADIAYAIAASIGDKAAIASSMSTQVNARRLAGMPIRPIVARGEEALRIAEEARDPGTTGYSLNSLVTAYLAIDAGSRQAERVLRRALAQQEMYAPQHVSAMYANLGVTLMARGDYAGAYRALTEGLPADFAQSDQEAVGFKEVQLGRIMEAQNDPELALEFFRRGAARRMPKQFTIMGYLGMAEAYRALGRYDEAKAAADKALAMAKPVSFRGLIARALVTSTEIQIERGQTADAESTLREAIEYSRESGYQEAEIQSRLTLGNLYFRTGRHGEARALAEETIELANRFDFPRPERYRAMMLAARSEHALGNRDKAMAMYRNAIDAIEAARGEVAGSERQQRLFFEPFHAAYTELADLLLELGAVAEALVYAERAKGRVLLDSMARERKSAESTLSEMDAERLASLVRNLGETNKRMIALRASGEASAKELQAAERDQRRAQLALDRFDSDVAGRDPQLRAVRGGSETVDAAALDAVAARADLAILEFVVNQRATHLFVVTRGKVTHHRIDISAEELSRRVADFGAELAGRGIGYKAPARALYELLLAPAAAELRGKRLVCVVPDGVLWRVPFEALLRPDGRAVVEQAAFFYVPSISVYRDMLARQRQTSGAQRLVAFGNPAIEGARTNIEAVYRGIELAPLPDAESEAKAIAKVWQPAAAVYTGAQASERTAKREVERARIVHFAAHGIFDDARPMFSQIVLARDPRSDDDGVLQAWELMRLDLSADLVVLSACDTARGRYGAGEGLIGMSWALFAAGCPSTVVAHWKVSSRSTADLMVAFHRNLAASSGRPFAKAEALRAAQLSMLRDARTSHPFYWAGFVLLGSAN